MPLGRTSSAEDLPPQAIQARKCRPDGGCPGLVGSDTRTMRKSRHQPGESTNITTMTQKGSISNRYKEQSTAPYAPHGPCQCFYGRGCEVTRTFQVGGIRFVCFRELLALVTSPCYSFKLRIITLVLPVGIVFIV